ncbi:3'(2'),5'-bisphosphate nucleotidase CysQ [Carnimonas bestiolae]|uniref:3'(2'),5'-bisphosphate nucleotidase CysQ n=1 Tax=Carnimonas bestiolae TaxID=3402172 RepID=UPI003EDBAA07
MTLISDQLLKEWQSLLIDIACQAGDAILAIYRNGHSISVSHKEDHSPVTEADKAAHQIIVNRLARLSPALPVLSEESSPLDIDNRLQWQQFWLVDPLDGTRDFLRRNDEFTVNIALIDAGKVVLSVVVAPALNDGYSACRGESAWRFHPPHYRATRTDITARPWRNANTLRVVESRSHGRGIPEPWQARLPPYQRVAMGSSLKFCAIARGDADLYVRSGPTSEWDTAAAQFVLEQAGGAVRSLQGMRVEGALSYNQRDTLINPSFVALAPGLEALFESWQ